MVWVCLGLQRVVFAENETGVMVATALMLPTGVAFVGKDPPHTHTYPPVGKDPEYTQRVDLLRLSPHPPSGSVCPPIRHQGLLVVPCRD